MSRNMSFLPSSSDIRYGMVPTKDNSISAAANERVSEEHEELVQEQHATGLISKWKTILISLAKWRCVFDRETLVVLINLHHDLQY